MHLLQRRNGFEILRETNKKAAAAAEEGAGEFRYLSCLLQAADEDSADFQQEQVEGAARTMLEEQGEKREEG